MYINEKFGFINNYGQLVIDTIYDAAGHFSKARIARVTKDGKKFTIDKNGEKVQERMACLGPALHSQHFPTFKKNGKTGFFLIKNLRQTKEQFPQIFDILLENSTGYAAVKKDSLWAIIHNSGIFMTPFLYDSIEVNPGRLINSFFKIRQNGKYGFLNHQGKLVVAPKYYKLSFYSSNRLCRAWIDETLWFFIDEKGQEYYKPN